MMPQINLGQNLAQGFQLGANIRQIQQQREAEQQAMQEQETFKTMIEAHRANPTYQSTSALMMRFPKMAEAFKSASEYQSKEAKDSDFIQGLEAFESINNGRADIAQSILDKQITAYENSGKDASSFKRMKAELDADPKGVSASLGIMLAAIDPDRWDKVTKTKIAMSEESRKAQLFDSEKSIKQSEAAIKAEQAAQEPFNTLVKIEQSVQEPLKTKELRVKADNAALQAKLDMDLKRQQIATSRANQLQSQQGVLESQARVKKLTQVQAPSDGRVVDLGLPTPARVPWANMTDEKQRNILQGAIYKTSEKELNKKLENVNKAQSAAQLAQRFIALNRRNTTGGLVDRMAQGAIGMVNADYDEMRSITAQLAPNMRQEGSGATSDYDAKQFERATLSVDKKGTANLNIAKALNAKAQAASEYQEYMQNYLTQNGTIADADRYWKEYSNKNPILDPSKPNTFELNKNRLSPEIYFSIKAEKERRGVK
jgi:hypothetical protein